jgi:hypothetical protein
VGGVEIHSSGFDGRQDTGEFLVVDTAKLPAQTRQTIVSITVG